MSVVSATHPNVYNSPYGFFELLEKRGLATANLFDTLSRHIARLEREFLAVATRIGLSDSATTELSNRHLGRIANILQGFYAPLEFGLGDSCFGPRGWAEETDGLLIARRVLAGTVSALSFEMSARAKLGDKKTLPQLREFEGKIFDLADNLLACGETLGKLELPSMHFPSLADRNWIAEPSGKQMQRRIVAALNQSNLSPFVGADAWNQVLQDRTRFSREPKVSAGVHESRMILAVQEAVDILETTPAIKTIAIFGGVLRGKQPDGYAGSDFDMIFFTKYAQSAEAHVRVAFGYGGEKHFGSQAAANAYRQYLSNGIIGYLDRYHRALGTPDINVFSQLSQRTISLLSRGPCLLVMSANNPTKNELGRAALFYSRGTGAFAEYVTKKLARRLRT